MKYDFIRLLICLSEYKMLNCKIRWSFKYWVNWDKNVLLERKK